jgi:hypothetical protein
MIAHVFGASFKCPTVHAILKIDFNPCTEGDLSDVRPSSYSLPCSALPVLCIIFQSRHDPLISNAFLLAIHYRQHSLVECN